MFKGLDYKSKRELHKAIFETQTIRAQDIEELTAGFEPSVRAAFLADWEIWARDKQLEQNLERQDWVNWLLLAGRGFGKTRTGAEWVKWQIQSGNMRHIALVGRTPGDVRAVMVEGSQSGDSAQTGSSILQITTDDFKPTYHPSTLKLKWPNGATCSIYSAEKPDKLRGPQHDGYWCDEIAAWRFIDETWNQLQLGLRLRPADGRNPRGIITTTPRAIPWIKTRVEEAKRGGATIVTRGKTVENELNLAENFKRQVYEKYGGTPLGRQELDGEVLESVRGALLNRDHFRYPDAETVRHIKRRMIDIVVCVDPQKKDKQSVETMERRGKGRLNDLTGIVVCGKDSKRRGYVLEDLSGSYPPELWAKIATSEARNWGASAIIAETNIGGDLVENVLKAYDPGINVLQVAGNRSATKAGRAQAVALLYKAGRIYHCGFFPELEDEWCTWDPEQSQESPDRLDATVYGMRHLLLSGDQNEISESDFFSFGGRAWTNERGPSREEEADEDRGRLYLPWDF